MNRILQLFLSFLKIGAFTFGGGYAMIPLIQREVVERKSWLKGAVVGLIGASLLSTVLAVAVHRLQLVIAWK